MRYRILEEFAAELAATAEAHGCRLTEADKHERAPHGFGRRYIFADRAAVASLVVVPRIGTRHVAELHLARCRVSKVTKRAWRELRLDPRPVEPLAVRGTIVCAWNELDASMAAWCVGTLFAALRGEGPKRCSVPAIGSRACSPFDLVTETIAATTGELTRYRQQQAAVALEMFDRHTAEAARTLANL